MTKRILFINHEMMPYVPESELSKMGRDLPQRAQEAGYEVRTFMPKWGNINERRGQLHPVIRLSGINIVIGDTDQPLLIKVASISAQSRIQVYFIDNEDYFNKRQLTTENETGIEYSDNGERAIFFARGVLETVKKQRWIPDIIHCQGWMGAVVPFYLKTAYKDEPTFANTKIITSLFHKQIKSSLGENFKEYLEYREASSALLEKYNDSFDATELGKLAIDYSDAVVEAGPNVNKELLSHAKKAKLPILKYPGEDYIQAYTELYNKLTGE